MLNGIKTWLLKNRIAACSIAREHAERAIRHAEQKADRLAQREIELRMRYAQQRQLHHTRHIVTLPGAR